MVIGCYFHKVTVVTESRCAMTMFYEKHSACKVF